GRAPALVVAALVLVATLPPMAVALWTSHAAATAPRPWSSRGVVAAAIGLAAVLIALGAAFPTPHFSIDVIYFVDAVQTAKEENARWDLLLWTMVRLATALRSWIAADHLIRAMNGAWAAVAVVALAGAA